MPSTTLPTDASENEEVLLDAPLAPDPYADEEMAAGGGEAVADEELKGSRLLIVRRAAEAIDFEGIAGGAIELACTFQALPGMRFTSATLTLRLATPKGTHFIDVQPRRVEDKQPVNFALDRKGKFDVKYLAIGASAEAGSNKQYAIYHCSVTGSGEGTPRATWVFTENPYRKDGLGSEQSLVLTVAARGPVAGTMSVAARVVRPGLRGAVEAIRDLVLGRAEGDRHHPISFNIPSAEPSSNLRRFLRLD
jgi:hypothetical protein